MTMYVDYVSISPTLPASKHITNNYLVGTRYHTLCTGSSTCNTETQNKYIQASASVGSKKNVYNILSMLDIGTFN